MRQISPGITWMLGQGFDSNVYVIESENQSLLIDSGLGDRIKHGFGASSNSLDILRTVIKEKEIKRVFLTHGHIDHVGGIMTLQSELNVEIIAFEIEAKYLQAGNNIYIDPILGSKCSPISVSQKVGKKDIIEVGNFSFEVIHTPGHTHGSVSLWESNYQILVSGDTVFPQGSFGRTDLPSGSSKELIESLAILSKLDVKILLPGHMDPLISPTDSVSKSIKRSYRIAREMLF
jgi:hydroxyacylglutathione hydrolase